VLGPLKSEASLQVNIRVFQVSYKSTCMFFYLFLKVMFGYDMVYA
jgi:hypothetical protein